MPIEMNVPRIRSPDFTFMYLLLEGIAFYELQSDSGEMDCHCP